MADFAFQLADAVQKFHHDGAANHGQLEVAAQALQLAHAGYVVFLKEQGLLRAHKVQPVQLQKLHKTLAGQPRAVQEFLLAHEAGLGRQIRFLANDDVGHEYASYPLALKVEHRASLFHRSSSSGELCAGT